MLPQPVATALWSWRASATGRSSARIGAAAEWRMGVSYGLAPFSRTVRKDNLVQFGFKVDRALVVKTGVKSGAVIEGLDVIEDGGAGLGAGGEAMMIDQFVFEAAKERLDESVIVAVGFATHGRD